MLDENKTPWYQDGLAFQCQGCGVCCRGPGGYVWLTEDEARAIAPAMGFTFEQFAARLLRNTISGLALIDDPVTGDCPLIDDEGRCKLYELRPTQCRTWPWWKENLVSRERWESAASRCPGVNKGSVHSRFVIETEMAKDI